MVHGERPSVVLATHEDLRAEDAKERRLGPGIHLPHAGAMLVLDLRVELNSRARIGAFQELEDSTFEVLTGTRH
jgi:hypothetical protein